MTVLRFNGLYQSDYYEFGVWLKVLNSTSLWFFLGSIFSETRTN